MAHIRPELEYKRFLAEGRFMLQRCRASGRHFFYPRVAEPASGSTDLEWVPACGRGTVYSTTIVRQRPPATDYNVALIDLEEGPRMMSRVVGVAPDAVRIGMTVLARIIRDADQPLVVFGPAPGFAQPGGGRVADKGARLAPLLIPQPGRGNQRSPTAS